MEKIDDTIKAAQIALRNNKLREQNIPDMILQIIKEDKWRERKLENLDTVERFEYFPDFVKAPLPSGLDTEWEVVDKLIKGYVEVEIAVGHLLTLKQGQRTDIGYNTPEVKIKKSKKYKDLEQLETHRPDLLEKVKNNELSIYAAMKEAGFRKPRIEVTPEPNQIAKALKEKLNAEQIAELIKLLMT